MINIKIFSVILIFVVFLGCHHEDKEQPLSVNSEDNVQETKEFNIKSGVIHSAVIDANYSYKVYIPTSISLKTKIHIIYATDGGFEYTNYFTSLENKNIQVAFVSLGTGGRRSIDFLLPGTYDYYQFFVSEFIPYIEQTYGIRANERILVGHSHGGTMVGTFLYLEEPDNQYFSNYLAFDSSFWRQQEEMLELGQKRYAESSILNAKVILTSAPMNTPEGTFSNYQPTEDYLTNLQNIGFESIEIHRLIAGTGHMDNAKLSFIDALDILFSN